MDDPIVSSIPAVCPPHVKQLPRISRIIPADDTAPYRRLVAAVVLRAVRDIWFPDKFTTIDDTHDATQFLSSEIGQDLLAAVIGRA
ncbi:MAG: hypothetical protein Kow0031_38020 [Anaerolineae bacterium]